MTLSPPPFEQTVARPQYPGWPRRSSSQRVSAQRATPPVKRPLPKSCGSHRTTKPADTKDAVEFPETPATAAGEPPSFLERAAISATAAGEPPSFFQSSNISAATCRPPTPSDSKHRNRQPPAAHRGAAIFEKHKKGRRPQLAESYRPSLRLRVADRAGSKPTETYNSRSLRTPASTARAEHRYRTPPHTYWRSNPHRTRSPHTPPLATSHPPRPLANSSHHTKAQ